MEILTWMHTCYRMHSHPSLQTRSCYSCPAATGTLKAKEHHNVAYDKRSNHRVVKRQYVNRKCKLSHATNTMFLFIPPRCKCSVYKKRESGKYAGRRRFQEGHRPNKCITTGFLGAGAALLLYRDHLLSTAGKLTQCSAERSKPFAPNNNKHRVTMHTTQRNFGSRNYQTTAFRTSFFVGLQTSGDVFLPTRHFCGVVCIQRVNLRRISPTRISPRLVRLFGVQTQRLNAPSASLWRGAGGVSTDEKVPTTTR